MKKRNMKEDRYFDKMETAFGVDHKHENMTDEEKAQFDEMEELDIEKVGDFSKAKHPADSKLTQNQKESGKDATSYYKSIIDKMAKNQKTNVENPDTTRIGESKDDNALTRLDEDNLGTAMSIGVGMAVAVAHAFSVAPEYIEMFEDQYNESREPQIGDTYEGKIIDVTEHGERYTNPYNGEEGGSPQQGFRVEVLTEDGSTIVFYEMTPYREDIPSDGTTVSITIIEHPNTEYISPEMWSGQQYDVDMKEDKKYSNALTRLMEDHPNQINEGFGAVLAITAGIMMTGAIVSKAKAVWDKHVVAKRYEETGETKNLGKVTKNSDHNSRYTSDNDHRLTNDIVFKGYKEKKTGKTLWGMDVTDSAPNSDEYNDYEYDTLHTIFYSEEQLPEIAAEMKKGHHPRQSGIKPNEKISRSHRERGQSDGPAERQVEEFEPKKTNIEDDERDMYYGTGMEGLSHDDEDTDRYKEFEERNDELNDDKEGTTYNELKKAGKKYKKYKYGDKKGVEDEYHETPKVRVTNENKKGLSEEANTDLELKSVAKKVFSILKKFGLRPNYETGEINMEDGKDRQTTQLRIRENVLAIGINKYGLEKIVDDPNDYQKKVGEIYKAITDGLGSGFDFKSEVKGSHYLIWIKKGGDDVDKTIEDKQKKKGYRDPNSGDRKNKIQMTNKNESKMVYKDVIEENTFKAKGKLVSEEQVLKLANKVPSRVKIDETVFAITDGDNSYRLIWEGEEAIITHNRNEEMVSESIDEMKRLYNFNTNDSISTKKTITESGEDSFKRMFNQIRNGDGVIVEGFKDKVNKALNYPFESGDEKRVRKDKEWREEYKKRGERHKGEKKEFYDKLSPDQKKEWDERESNTKIGQDKATAYASMSRTDMAGEEQYKHHKQGSKPSYGEVKHSH